MSDVKPGRRERYAALTRAAIVDAARALFAERGFEATSMDDIGHRAEVSKGAVYHHFDNKQDLFAELCRESQRRLLESAVRTARGHRRPDDPWAGFTAAVAAFLAGYAADEQACALMRQAAAVLGADRAYQLEEEVSVPFLTATLESLAQAGALAPVPVEVTASLLTHLLRNAATLIAFAADRADRQATARQAETVILRLLTGLMTTERASDAPA
jgi:AcrR family transcriptional regulator